MQNNKIILWDLETTDLNADFGTLLCFGYKVLGDKKAQVVSITDFPSFEKDYTNDEPVVKKAGEILSTADVHVTWYGARFDLPFLNSKCVKYCLPSLPPIPHVDGWLTARYQMKLHSNRLASVSDFLGLEDKTPIKPSVWAKARTGHIPSIKYVVDHCRQDVEVLEQAYLRIRPLVKRHPRVVGNDGTCPICGKGKMQKRGIYVTQRSVGQRYQCRECYSWSKGRAMSFDQWKEAA